MKTDKSNGFVFSWAENSQGKMVHVEDVPRGLWMAARKVAP